MKQLVAMLLSLVVISGCAGASFKFSDARKLQVGMTTEELRQTMHAKPYLIQSRGDKQVWVWTHVNMLTGRTDSFSVIVQDGKVVEVPTIPDDFK